MKDLKNKKFGRLTAKNPTEKRHGTNIIWECLCDCGRITYVSGSSLQGNGTRSCGCLAKELATKRNRTHGMSKTHEYRTWGNMKDRCTNKNSKAYKDYGGRGIKICDRWLKFENFYNDMGNRPKGMSLDRIDNNRGYCKKNCRWTTRTKQQNNTRSNVMIKFNSETKSISQWEKYMGYKKGRIRDRLVRYKWSIIDSIMKPVRQKKI